MQNMADVLTGHQGKKLLFIFPHPDDESFLAGGLLQVAKKFGCETHLLCLTKGEKGQNAFGRGDLGKIRTREFMKAMNLLELDSFELRDFGDANLRETKTKWLSYIAKRIDEVAPSVIITFDHSGITGHPDHIIVSCELFNLLRSRKKRPVLFWRVPDGMEKKLFVENEALSFASKATHKLCYGMKEAITKIRAIYSHRSQMPSLWFKLRVLELFLFDHTELYFNVDFKRNYKYKFVEFKI